MTDNELIKALGCCIPNECCFMCKECPLKTRPQCQEVLYRETVDLINSQKAEIERLKGFRKEGFINLLGNCLVYSKNLKDYNDMRKGLKAEAIKDFAERLCEDRVSNDPVVIAVKVELAETESERE